MHPPYPGMASRICAPQTLPKICPWRTNLPLATETTMQSLLVQLSLWPLSSKDTCISCGREKQWTFLWVFFPSFYPSFCGLPPFLSLLEHEQVQGKPQWEESVSLSPFTETIQERNLVTLEERVSVDISPWTVSFCFGNLWSASLRIL